MQATMRSAIGMATERKMRVFIVQAGRTMSWRAVGDLAEARAATSPTGLSRTALRRLR